MQGNNTAGSDTAFKKPHGGEVVALCNEHTADEKGMRCVHESCPSCLYDKAQAQKE